MLYTWCTTAVMANISDAHHQRPKANCLKCEWDYRKQHLPTRLIDRWKKYGDVQSVCHEKQINPNTIKSYKILQKLSPKHAAHGVVQSTYPTCRHGKACLSKQPPWRAAGEPRQAHGRSRVEPRVRRAPCARFFSPPSLPSSFQR